MDTQVFELDGPTANREAIMSQHAAIKDLISQSDLPMNFAAALSTAIPANPTATDASVVLGAFIDFAMSMIATTAHIMGVLPEYRQNVADAVADFARKELPVMIDMLAKVPEKYTDLAAALDQSDPDLKTKLDALIQQFRDEHKDGTNG